MLSLLEYDGVRTVKRAIGYARVSTDKQADNGVSLPDQERRIRARAIADEVELVDLVIDDGYSGKDLERPGMQRVLEMVRTRQVDTLIVTKLDRLTRSVRDFQDLLDITEKAGVSIVSMGEGMDTGCAVGRMILNVMAVVTQWLREDIAEKTSAAMRHKRAVGEKTGGKIPYGYGVEIRGYRPNGRPIKGLVRNEAEQAVIAEVRRQRDQGLSLEQIAFALNGSGLRTREGGMWKRQYVWRILNAAESSEGADR